MKDPIITIKSPFVFMLVLILTANFNYAYMACGP